MFNSASSTSLNKSLNEFNYKPNRTSYNNMSRWIYSDPIENSTNNLSDGFYNSSIYLPNNKTLQLPPIPSVLNRTKSFRQTSALNSVENLSKSEFLMKNWSDKRNDMNRVPPSANTFDYDRKGRIGSWNNITEAFREDGRQFLFIQGPRETINNDFESQIEEQRKKLESNDAPKNLFDGRKLTKAYLEKIERERINVQTRHGLEFGNWNIIR